SENETGIIVQRSRGIPFYSCPVCHYTSPIKSNLKRHMLIHSQKRPHVCDICQKSFRQKEHLKSHMKVHFSFT
ncbi:hypothetical protein CDAR_174771, partial [Caerostris darwini]